MKNNIKNKELEIKKYYSERSWNLFVSFFTSFIAGLLSASLISIVLGQNASNNYTKFGKPIFIWALFCFGIFFIFYLILWLTLIYFNRRRDLNKLK